MAATAAAKVSTTAEDTLARKSADPNIVSGGRLVAKALKDESWRKVAEANREELFALGVVEELDRPGHHHFSP